MYSQSPKHALLLKFAAWIGIIIFLAGAALFAYAGTYSRFWADDYCYSAVLKHSGLLNGLVEWYQSNGNRISTVVVVALADLFGWRFIQFSPLVVLAMWACAWTFFLVQLSRLFRWKTSRTWLVLLALVEVYFAALLAPDRVQTIYWRMGTYHYTLPMPLLLINLGLLAIGFRQPGKRAAWFGAAGLLLSFFAAGLSETFAAMQSGALALAIAAAFLFFPREQRGKSVGLLSAALAGSLLMMAVMSQAPANSWRQDVMPPPDNLLLIIPYSLRYAGDYIFYTLRGQITPFLVYGALLFALGLLAVPTGPVHIAPRVGLVGAALSLLVMYALIVCSFAPSAFAALSYPAGRALMPGSFALLAGLGSTALFLGLTLRSLLGEEKQGWVFFFAVAALVLLSLYPLRASVVARNDIDRLSEWAGRWDARDQQIRQEAAAGSPNITVRQVSVVEGLEDIGPDAGHWVNKCATVFYGVQSITANP